MFLEESKIKYRNNFENEKKKLYQRKKDMTCINEVKINSSKY